MLHTFEGRFCSAKLFNFLFFRYCTFLYRSILGVSYFSLCFSYLQNLKTLPHEFITYNLQSHLATIRLKDSLQTWPRRNSIGYTATQHSDKS